MASARSLIPPRLGRLARRVWREMLDDDVAGRAAEMSYYFVLSVFPFLIFLAALAGTLPFTDAWGDVLNWITRYFPRQSQNMVFQIVLGLTRNRQSFLSLGLVGTAWAASSGLLSLMAALNTAYEVRETRTYIRRLGMAFLMVLVLALLLLATFGLLTAGDWIDRWLASRSRGLLNPRALFALTRWVASLVLLGAGLAILDLTLPNLRRPWRRALPGVGFVVAGWVLASEGFNVYTRHVGGFNRTYGVLGGFIVLMVWIFLVSLIALVGAEINCELDKMSRPP